MPSQPLPAKALRIGVVSDTHNLLRPEVLAHLRGSDHVIHAGDICGPEVLRALHEVAPLTVVRGNNDRGDWAAPLPHQHRQRIGEVGVGPQGTGVSRGVPRLRRRRAGEVGEIDGQRRGAGHPRVGERVAATGRDVRQGVC